MTSNLNSSIALPAVIVWLTAPEEDLVVNPREQEFVVDDATTVIAPESVSVLVPLNALTL